MHPESLSEPTPTTARDHLRQVIEEFNADGSSPGEVVIDLTGSDAVVILPTEADVRPSAVLAPVVNRARYRRVGVAAVSTKPGELSELATLVGPAGEPDVLRLVLAAQRRPRPASPASVLPPPPAPPGTAAP